MLAQFIDNASHVDIVFIVLENITGKAAIEDC